MPWAGHVARMPWDRLPRKMLSCWVPSKRPRGFPKITYGRSLIKCLKKVGLDDWENVVIDRGAWNSLESND